MTVASDHRALCFDRAACAALLLIATACGGAHGARASEPRNATSETLPDDIVELSALPIRPRYKDAERDFSELSRLLSDVRAVCIGESHDNPHHHYAQWQLVQALGETAKEKGRPFAVGFEMFQTPFQSALDAYEKSANIKALLRDSEFEDRWGKNAFPYYRPLLETGRELNARLLALNAPRELSKQIARGGLSSLSNAQRSKLPEMDLGDLEHRAFFSEAMGVQLKPEDRHDEPWPAPTDEAEGAPHEAASDAPAANSKQDNSETEAPPHHAMDPSNLYAAQVLWDESMTESAYQWLSESSEGQLVIIAGAGHCHRSAIPRRLERRGVHDVVAARAVMLSELGTSSAPRDDQFDLLLVLDDAEPNSSLPAAPGERTPERQLARTPAPER